MEWLQVKVFSDDESIKEAISSLFFDLGAEGVSETVDKGISQGVSACFSVENENKIKNEIDVFVKRIQEIFPNAIHLKCEFSYLKKDKWAEKYKEFYKAQKLTDRFFLRPKWDNHTPVPQDMFPLILDPGQAFGTGLHQSTRLTMKLMEDIAGLYPALNRVNLMDVGTGSGILAIAAFKLGFGQITAIDNDLDAVRVARENIDFNECQDIDVSGRDLAEFKSSFDVILSNILLETHFLLAPHYRRLLVPGGQLILSGLL
ncbi:MAG: methyltransferase domain-containing protein, partial [Proteobacteria bacterium]|nr:methyltransferase domain-containing protein [Pseudomonadota bacterium]